MNSCKYYAKPDHCSLALFLLASAIAMSGNLNAAEVTTTMPVSIIIESGCRVTSTAMTFPTPTSATAQSATAQLDVICTNGTPFEIGLDAGAHSTDVANRVLQDAATLEELIYSIYKSGAYVAVWGNTQGVDTTAGTGDGNLQQFAAYGRGEAPAELPSAGTYTDTINIFVYY